MQKQQAAPSLNTNDQTWFRKTFKTAIAIIAGFASMVALAAPTVELTGPGAGQTYVATATVDFSVSVTPSPGATIKSVAYYRGSTLIATVTTAPYAYTWSKVAAGTYSITAKATDNLNAVTTSTARTITVNANKAPTVSLASPAAASTTIYPNNITLTVDAADSDGAVTKVDYYRSTTLIGSSTTPPFSYTWATPAIGTYSLTAKATDDKGAVTTSAARSIYVKAAPPTLTLTSPSNGQTHVAPASMTLTAEATAAAGATISSVEFYRGTTRIASDTSAPYAYAWNNVAAGTYQITAKVTDNRGNIVTTPASIITVKANQAPNVALISPQANEVAIYPNNVTLSAQASDTDGSVKSVSFYRSTTLIGTVTTPPYNYTWAKPAIGTYSITAKATDDKGAVTTTAVSPLKVTAAAPTVSLTAPQAGQTFIIPGTIALSASATPATGAAISSVEFYRNGTLLYKDTTSPYTYSWTNASAGTYQIIAKVTDNSGNIVTTPTSTITVKANQAPSVMVSTPDNGQTYVAPATVTISANASDADGTISKVELYRGTTRLATLSAIPYTYTWANAAAGTYSITAKATDDKGVITTSEAKNIVINTNKAPTIAMLTPDAGQNFAAPANINLTVNVNDSDGTVTKVDYYRSSTLIGTSTTPPFNYAWANVAVGTYSITAKATDDKGATATTTARSITVKTNQAPTITLSAPTDNQTFAAPANITISANAADSDGSIQKVEFYQGTTLLGTKTAAPYSFTWSNVQTGTYSITAKATDDKGTTTTSAARTVKVEAANKAPTVDLTSPNNNETFAAPATITISANAADSDGTIAKVEFYQGTTLLGTKTAAPYSFTWSNVQTGTYSITAKATDDKGTTTTSTARTVKVEAANKAPTVDLTAPNNNETFTAPATITISGNAADSDGSIARVEFYQGATLLGTKTAAPYSFTWNDVQTGTYSITAKATDDKGTTTTSTARTVKVEAANKAPTVDLTSPNNNETFTAPAIITISANAADSDGSIAKVEFYQGVTLLGTKTTAPYSFTWSNVQAGTYTITAKATDDKGTATTSTARTVKVEAANKAPTVDLTSPNNNETFTAPAAIAISANAADSDGSIAKVDFYQGVTLLGTKTTAPYSFTWSNVQAGTYSITAKVTDDKGTATTSAARTVKVENNVPVTTSGIYYIHTDHLNTPRLVTNEQNQAVWENSPVTEPFGTSMPNEDPRSTGKTFVMNLRFPGQYFDQETNTHYNYYRDNYIPGLGRYGQSDPIGLNGGINTYAYVTGNPLGYVDPAGLVEIKGNRLPSGNNVGQWRFKFEFCGRICTTGRSVVGEIFKTVGGAQGAIDIVSPTAGLSDVDGLWNQIECAKYDGMLEDFYKSKGYKTGRIGGSDLTEAQARDFMREAGAKLPKEIRDKYDWDTIIERAQERSINLPMDGFKSPAQKEADRMLKYND